ncbi:MAG: glycerophosphodiester phosphodiesterase [bacterium]
MINILIIAHRGASGHAPENTMAAFKMALEMKAEMIEIDVHLSADSHLVVIHDESVDRTTDGEGEIREMKLEGIKLLDAGGWFSEEFAGERIPTLPEVIDLVRGRAELNIEIKGGSEYYPGIEGKLLECLRGEGFVEDTIVSSFDHDCLKKLSEMDSSIRIGYLYSGGGSAETIIPKALQYRAFSIHPPHLRTSRKLVELAHAQGIRVYPWTANTPRQMKRLVRFGVDGIITNYPDRLWGLMRSPL